MEKKVLSFERKSEEVMDTAIDDNEKDEKTHEKQDESGEVIRKMRGRISTPIQVWTGVRYKGHELPYLGSQTEDLSQRLFWCTSWFHRSPYHPIQKSCVRF